MTTLFDIIPIENEGMSVITAIVLVFWGAGIGFIVNMFRKEFEQVRNEINIRMADTKEETDNLFSKYDSLSSDITDIKTNIAKTHEAVDWIKKYMETGKR